MPARQRPNSMLEWVAGRNITPRQPRSSQPRGVLKLQVFTDDVAETDTLAVTYPRSGNTSRATPRMSASKQVAFTNESPQALVKRDVVGPPLDSDLEVETSGSEDAVEVVKIIKRRKPAKKATAPTTPPELPSQAPVTPPQEPVCLKDLPAPPDISDDDAGDIDPHPSCPCTKCAYGRKLLRKARKKRKAKAETDGEATTVVSPAPVSAPPANGDRKGDVNTNGTGETAPVLTDEVQKSGNGNNGNGEDTKVATPDKASSAKAPSAALVDTSSRNSKKQRLPQAYPPPVIRNPNLIVPPRAEVLQIEHAVETPEDPRPNAFVDNEHGICRVYHGPAYGNPYGSLYPRRGLSGPPPFQPLPAGVPHPMHNPYYNGFDPEQMARHGQPPPPGWPAGGYLPPPPPIMAYPPGHPPEVAYPAHMPWPNYQVLPEGQKERNGQRDHHGHKKVSSPVVPPVVPPLAPHVVPAFMPPVPPPAGPPPAGPPAAEPAKAAPADVIAPQTSNDQRPSHVSPPFGLLTPRTIAAKFSEKPISDPSSKGKDKDKGWGNNVGPGSPSHKSGSRHSPTKGEGGWGGGWGGGSAGPFDTGKDGGGNGWGREPNNNKNAWGNSPRASNKDIKSGNGGGNGWGGSNNNGSHHNHNHGSRHNTPPKNDNWGGGRNNDGANDNWGAGSPRSGSKKSSNHSRNSANQRAEDIGGEGWGGGWGSASTKDQSNRNGDGDGWGGGGSPRRSNNGGHNAFNASPRGSEKGSGSHKNTGNNGGWGKSSNHGSDHGSGSRGNKSGNGWGNDNGNGHGRRGSGSNHRHSNSPPSGRRHASGGSGNRHSPPRSGDTRDSRDRQRHRSPSRMPGSWESVPSNNAGPQGTPGERSRGHSSPPRERRSGGGNNGGSPPGGRHHHYHHHSEPPHGGGGAFGRFEGTWNAGSVGGGGRPSWGDPTAAQSTKATPGQNW